MGGQDDLFRNLVNCPHHYIVLANNCLYAFPIIFTARISNVVVLTTDYVFYFVMYVIIQNSVLNEHNMNNKECYILLISANKTMRYDD